MWYCSNFLRISVRHEKDIYVVVRCSPAQTRRLPDDHPVVLGQLELAALVYVPPTHAGCCPSCDRAALCTPRSALDSASSEHGMIRDVIWIYWYSFTTHAACLHKQAILSKTKLLVQLLLYGNVWNVCDSLFRTQMFEGSAIFVSACIIQIRTNLFDRTAPMRLLSQPWLILEMIS
jgi:hypothetical protein